MDPSLRKEKDRIQSEILKMTVGPFIDDLCDSFPIEAGEPFLFSDTEVGVYFRGYGQFLAWTADLSDFSERIKEVPALLKARARKKRNLGKNLEGFFTDIEDVLYFSGASLFRDRK